VLLAVTDTGVGMDEETQRHLFEPFFTTKDAATGTGLGLATVYGSVSQSGGHVWVISEPGIGSTFKILLPRVDAPITALDVVTEGTAPIGRAGTILVVEDEPALRALMRSVLTRAGYEVILAPDGEEGLRQARTSLDHIDLVLTDVVMPVMGGAALAEAVHGLRADLPVLLMSGFPENAVGHDGLLDPSWAFIGKPFTSAELLERIRDLLEAVPA
jgi:CheY-like chemotaxis protein